MAAILNSAILDSAILVFPLKLTHTCQDWFPPFPQKIHSHFLPQHCTKNLHSSFWLNLMMAAILNSAIFDWAILHNKNFTHSFWLKLMMAATLNSTTLDSAILSISSETHSHLSRLVPTICTKNLHSFIMTQNYHGSHLEFCHLEFGHLGFSHLSFFLSNSLTVAKIVSQHLHKKNFTHSFWLNLMMATILNSTIFVSDTAIMDSDTLLSSPRFTQIHSHSTLTLTQTNSIWLTWWWQPSWILPFLFLTLPSWIQRPCYLLPDSLRYTLTPLWL